MRDDIRKSKSNIDIGALQCHKVKLFMEQKGCAGESQVAFWSFDISSFYYFKAKLKRGKYFLSSDIDFFFSIV